MGSVAGDGYRIDKIIYQSRPGNYVTGLLYLPEDAGPQSPPRGAVLFVSGHHGHARNSQEDYCTGHARASE